MAENPSMVSKIVIGQSYEGRPLNVLRVNHTNQLSPANEVSSYTQQIICSLHGVLFDCSFPFPCLSSVPEEATVPPSGSTLESIPESGSLRPAAPGSPRRSFDNSHIVFGCSSPCLQLLTTNLPH